MNTTKLDLPNDVTIAQWRKDHPPCAKWDRSEVIEAIMIGLARDRPDRVNKIKGVDGILRFTVKPPTIQSTPAPHPKPNDESTITFL